MTLGTITATGKNSQAGGLVGKNAATVTNCYSNVAVTSAYCAAGLIAYNLGLVEKCYATGKDVESYSSANEFLKSLIKCKVIESGNSFFFNHYFFFILYIQSYITMNAYVMLMKCSNR